MLAAIAEPDPAKARTRMDELVANALHDMDMTGDPSEG